MRRLGAACIILAGGAFAAPALAQNCEAIQSPFAYNECLAKSAPPRAGKAASGKGAVDPESTVNERPRGGRRYGRRARSGESGNGPGIVINRRSSRRMSATIDAGPALARPADPWAQVRGPARRKRR